MLSYVWFVISCETVIFVLFSAVAKYEENQNAALKSHYGMFQDIQIMIFVGFGFIMVFLKKYSYSSVGFNFLLAALMAQWSMLCQGFFDLNEDYKIEIGIISLYRADVATSVVLISMGAVLGRTTHTQLIVMGILEIVAYSINTSLNSKVFKASDVGGSMLVHSFGAYFGLAVSYTIGKSRKNLEADNKLENKLYGATYESNLLAMLGTLFLWVYWPSINAIDLENDMAHRAVINTYLSLTASCVTAFAASQMSSKDRKFKMVHIQNSTLAGGVAIGASTHLMVQPFGAILIGMLSGGTSVYGYTAISPFLERHFGIQDTCGIHNLHGMPGILGGFIAIIMAALANEDRYGKTLYEVYSARANPIISPNPEYIPLESGDGRTAGQQAAYQCVVLIVTVLVAVISGIVSGSIMKLRLWSHLSAEAFYDDSVIWDIPEIDYRTYQWQTRGKLINPNAGISKISI